MENKNNIIKCFECRISIIVSKINLLKCIDGAKQAPANIFEAKEKRMCNGHVPANQNP